jgi:signal peptidase I
MKRIWRLARNLWRKLPYHWTVAAGLAAVVGVAAGRNFLDSVCVVTGSSMAPTYEPGACLLSAAVSGPLERGDVVVIDDGFADYAVKRIVGLPGETVQFWRGQVFIDRQAISEPYVPTNIYTYARPRRGTYILGQTQFFVMGDNRLKSVDSRTYGPIQRKQIKRRVALPENTPRAVFTPYMLPEPGSVLPRSIVSKTVTASNFRTGLAGYR